MFYQPKLQDTGSAISSPESGSGRSPCDVPDGQMIDLSGQARAHANLSARQAEDLGLQTSGTYGLPGSGSLTSVALAKSLASRFPMLSNMDGSISSPLTAKAWVTPSGRYVFDPRTSASPSHADASTLLPSVSAREWKDSSQAQILARLDRGDGVAKRICALSPQLRLSTEVVGLNPSFAAWMMDLPSAWARCMPSVTHSMQKRLKRSSSV